MRVWGLSGFQAFGLTLASSKPTKTCSFLQGPHNSWASMVYLDPNSMQITISYRCWTYFWGLGRGLGFKIHVVGLMSNVWGNVCFVSPGGWVNLTLKPEV